ncbi:MAG TPA: alanine racemase, partial [Tepiditoga sp.]|nr:alanine racemase [Tepiditoga sp.]
MKNSRNTYAEINLENYISNLDFIKKQSGQKVIPVLKADGYGHGAVKLSKEAEKNGYNFFAAAFTEEALEIINNTENSRVLILNYIEPEKLLSCLPFAGRIVPTITSVNILKKYIDLAGKDIKKFKFNINFNTGMFRTGINEYETDELIKLIKDNNILTEGIYSHYATADENDDFSEYQYNKFTMIKKYLNDSGLKYEYSHMSNSAAALINPERKDDFIRTGIASYGMQPSEKYNFEQLKPVMKLVSKIVKINNLDEKTSIGYGRSYFSEKKMSLGIIPVGYADGYRRSFSNKSKVIINGQICDVIGRVSMDQIIVDITEKNVSLNDEAVL